MTRIRLSVALLAFCLCALGFVVARDAKPDKIHVVFFQNAKGQPVIHWLEKAAPADDALALRGAVLDAAREEGVLPSVSGGYYIDSGGICSVTTPSGGRIYYCGDCKGLGCARVKAINQ